MKRFLRKDHINVDNVATTRSRDVEIKSLELCNKILTPLDFSKDDVKHHLCQRFPLLNQFSEMHPVLGYRKIYAKLLKTISRGTTIYVDEFIDPVIREIIELNGFTPYIIPSNNEFKPDLDILERNSSEYMVYITSIPTPSGLIDIEHIEHALEITAKNEGGIILDLSGLNHIYKLEKAKGPISLRDEMIRIMREIGRIFNEADIEESIVILSIPLDKLHCGYPPLSLLTGKGEWPKLVKNIFNLEEYVECSFASTTILPRAIIYYDEIDSYIQGMMRKYMRIALEVLNEYIILPSNIIGGDKLLLMIRSDTSFKLLNDASKDGVMVDRAVMTRETLDRVGIIGLLHVYPYRNMDEAEYRDSINKIRNIVGGEHEHRK